MALLTNQIDEDMNKLLSICVNKLVDENWEAKNAAVQVVESKVRSNSSGGKIQSLKRKVVKTGGYTITSIVL